MMYTFEDDVTGLCYITYLQKPHELNCGAYTE